MRIGLSSLTSIRRSSMSRGVGGSLDRLYSPVRLYVPVRTILIYI